MTVAELLLVFVLGMGAGLIVGEILLALLRRNGRR